VLHNAGPIPLSSGFWQLAAVGHQPSNSLKNERVHGSRYETRDAARSDVFEYIEVFYNRSGRHSLLGSQSPAWFYDAWLKTQSNSELAA
jgi:putative transposase